MGRRNKVNIWDYVFWWFTTGYWICCIVLSILMIMYIYINRYTIFPNGNGEKVIYSPPVPISTAAPMAPLGISSFSTVPVNNFGIQSLPAARQIYWDYMRDIDNDDIPRININVGGDNSRFEESFEEGFGASRVRGKKKMPIIIERRG